MKKRKEKINKILIDVNHPFDVYFFKYIYYAFIRDKFEVLVTASNKKITYKLLDELNINHIQLGTYGASIFSKMFMLLFLDVKMFFICLKFKPDLILGHISFRAAHIAWILRIRNILFTDTDHAWEQLILIKPFASKIVTPSSFPKNLGNKHLRINTVFELNYLHPSIFKPSTNILNDLKILNNRHLFLLRFISWDATHDINKNHLSESDKYLLVNRLSKLGNVIISSEYELPDNLKKYEYSGKLSDIHSLLFYCTAFIGEGASMASEAACLGTPSIYINPIKLGYISDLEDNWGMIKTCLSVDQIMEHVANLDLDNTSDPKTKNNLKNYLLNKEIIDKKKILALISE